MNLPELGSHFNSVSVEAVHVAGTAAAKILVYAEVVEDGADIIFLVAGPSDNQFLTPMDLDIWPVADGIQRAWSYARSFGEKHEWEAVALRIEDGRMAVSLFYPGEVDACSDPFEKQDRLIQRYFPGMR